MAKVEGLPPRRPSRPEFSSGPCVKFPGWQASALVERAWLGRSHRARGPREQIRDVLRRIGQLLAIPDGYRVGIVPASNSGAMEMALWNLLGPRPVDIPVWEYFGSLWAADVRDELRLADCRILDAPYGRLPDLTAIRPEADTVFVWNGTTSGARCPDAAWISSRREGLTICDATSAVFAQPLDWPKLDVVTFSWQKALGGEGAHGVLVLGPRAAERLRRAPPQRGLPRVLRLVRRDGGLIEELYDGATLNTPSMLCVADCLLALEWVESIGGQAAMIDRAEGNFRVVQDWLDASDWLENLVAEPAHRSRSSVCMRPLAPEFRALDEAGQRRTLARMAALLDEQGVARDVVNHRRAPPSLRVWCGGTVERDDLERLLPWLDWAWRRVRPAGAA